MCYAPNVSVKYGCCVCVCVVCVRDVFGWQEISLFVLAEHVFGQLLESTSAAFKKSSIITTRRKGNPFIISWH